MKITKVDVLKIHSNLRPTGWSPICCRIYTDEGIYGDGEAALAYRNAPTAAFGMIQDFAKLIIGMDPMKHEVIWDKLYRSTFWGQNGGPVVFAGISAIDMALWDIKGKRYGVPVHELLGGKKRDSVRTYASQLQFGWYEDKVTPGLSLEDYVKAAKIAVAEGYDCIKVDFFTFRPDGSDFTDEDRLGMCTPDLVKLIDQRVAAVRDAVGPDVDIIMENHSFLDAQTAVQIGNVVKKYNIFYYEEPTTPTPRLSKFVGDKTGLPIASGERIYSRWQYAEYFEKDALQVIQPDIGTCGGISEAKKICDMAYVYDVGVQVHVCAGPLCTAAALQLEAVIPNFTIHEHHTYALKQDNRELCIYDYQPVNGKFAIPDRPGIGNELSEIAFKRAQIVTIE